MECCFAPKRKNRPPTAKEYQPYEPTGLSRVKVLVPNDTQSINEDIDHKKKANHLTKLRLKFDEENIPFPPRTVKVNIAM
jgi:hypothetical protein